MPLYKTIIFYVAFFGIVFNMHAAQKLNLIENLRKAQPGDFIVTSYNKNFSLLHIWSKNNHSMAIEEISIPAAKIPKNHSWRQWVKEGAPKNSSWVIYVIDLQSAQCLHTYALCKQGWLAVAPRDNILYTLLNLEFQAIPTHQRKRVGGSLLTPRHERPLWQPALIFNGQHVAGIHFDGWKTQWPKDGSDLSGMQIEAYLPAANSTYPNYFPYWLQISGAVACAKIRIVDTGTGLTSPAAPPLR